MIIGLTGKNAAGKGELASHLKSKGFACFSLSDALRDEATKRNLGHSRETLIKLGTEMREQFGHAILAIRINDKIKSLARQGKQNFAIDSIRNPGEIAELRNNKNFILIGVDANAEVRFKRLIKRGRAGDAKTLKEFMEHEEKENNKEGSGQQLGRCMELADRIINGNGTIEEANKELDLYLNSLKKVKYNNYAKNPE